MPQRDVGGAGLVLIKSFKTGSTTLATYIAQVTYVYICPLGLFCLNYICILVSKYMYAYSLTCTCIDCTKQYVECLHVIVVQSNVPNKVMTKRY